MKFGDLSVDEEDIDVGCSIVIKNPLSEFAEVELVVDEQIFQTVQMAPNSVKEVPVPGPAKYDLRVRLMKEGSFGHPSVEELRPAAFAWLYHEDVKKPSRKTTDDAPEAQEVEIRSMADMFRGLEEKEAATS